jgi:putative nucleotidyltransferase with HDIG domain
MPLVLENNTAAIEAFLAKHQTIKALPENTVQITRMTADPNCHSAQLLKMIEKDAALAGAIMKAVNSAFYSLPTKLTRLDRAIAYLGMKTVKEVAVSTCLSKMCKPVNFGSYSARDLWDHGIAVAIVARELTVRSNRFDSEEAFLVGVLHDIGLMLSTQSEPNKGTELLTRAELGEGSFAELEQEIFGFRHSELGASLAKRWGFPESHSAVIQFHHNPDEAPEQYRELCSHMYIADVLACEAKIGCPLSAAGELLDDHYLDAAGLSTPIIEEVMEKVALLARLHLS